MSPTSESLCSIPDLLRGAALQHLQHADLLLTGTGPMEPTAVHETRKSVKRVRAVLHLIRGDLGARFADWNGRMRTINRHLASTRDLDVCLEALLDLQESLSPKLQSVSDRWQSEFTLQQSKSRDDITSILRQTLRDELSAVVQGVSAWDAATQDFSLIKPAIRKLVRQARRKIVHLETSPESDDIHALRKLVKLRLYWLEFLRPIWPRGFADEHSLVAVLSDCLGSHHDLAVLKDSLQRFAVGQDSVEADPLPAFLEEIHARQRRLFQVGILLAKRLFAERPRAFSRRWASLTDIWSTMICPAHAAET